MIQYPNIYVYKIPKLVIANRTTSLEVESDFLLASARFSFKTTFRYTLNILKYYENANALVILIYFRV